MALVTGAAAGIGRATALRLSAEGARVFAADVDAGGLAETLEALRSAGGEARTHTLDVADRAACRAAVAACVEAMGGLDVLCNIAGVMGWHRVTEVDEAAWDRMVSINLEGVFFLTQAALPHLLERRGVVVNMSSAAGLRGQAYTAPYCITKAGVLAFTRCLAVEYGKQGLRAVALCPGGVMTRIAREVKLPEGADMQLFQKLMPLVPPAQPEEVAAAVAYLASEEARFVNGAHLSIDGGQTAG